MHHSLFARPNTISVLPARDTVCDAVIGARSLLPLLLLTLCTLSALAQDQETATDGERIIHADNVDRNPRLFSDIVYVFLREEGGWREEARLPSESFGSFGGAVAIRDNQVAVSDLERIVTFERLGDVWTEATVIESAEPGARWEVLEWASDDVLVGAGWSGGVVLVQVHRWNGSSWEQISLTPSDDPDLSDWTDSIVLGGGVAVADSLVVVGSWNQVTPAGAAYVFRRTEGGWMRDTTLVPADATLTIRPQISGPTIYVKYRPSRARDTYDTAVFEFNDSTDAWEETQVLLDFSFFVLDGDRAAYLADTPRSVVVVERDSTTGRWQKTATLDPSVASIEGYVDVDLSGDVLVARMEQLGTDPWQSDVFVLDTLTGQWNREATLTGRSPPEPITGGRLECVNGMAGPFPCDRVDLLSYLPTESMGGVVARETELGQIRVTKNVGGVWGWSSGDREFALVTGQEELAFVEVTDPENPVHIGYTTARCGTRTTCNLFPGSDGLIPDVNVYGHVAFLSEGEGRRYQTGPLLAIDLRRILSLTGPTCSSILEGLTRDGVCFVADTDLGNDLDESRFLWGAMNLAVNHASGFLYATEAQVGGYSGPVVDLAFVDLSDPLDPVVVGSYDDPDGDAHEVQCVMYRGPDADHVGKEVCFISAGSAFQIVDVTDKADPVRLASVSPAEVGFHHQGQLTTDHRYFYMADAAAGRTIIWDVTDLENPTVTGFHDGPTMATANTVYVDENLVFQAATANGVRVFDVSGDVANPVELGWFDTLPATDESFGHGAWSAYPYLPSGNVLVTSGELLGPGQGLFVLRPTAAPVATEEAELPATFSLSQNYPNPFHSTAEIAFSLHLSGKVRINVYDVLGRHVGRLVDQHLVPGRHTVTWDARGLPPGVYLYRLTTRSATKARTAILLK